MIVDEEEHLAHYGILHRSGRYPWGSGGDVETRSRDFLGTVRALKKKGLSDVEIARGMSLYTEDGKPWSTTEFRAAKSVANNARRQADITRVERMKAHGDSNSAIARKMGIGESQVRALLVPGQKDRVDVLQATSNMLKDSVDAKGYIDIGAGVEHRLGISSTKLATAVAMLKEQGYVVHPTQVPQLGTTQLTTVKVLAPPGTTYMDVKRNQDKITQIEDYSEDGGRSWTGIVKPLSIPQSRVQVKYKDDGGSEADGVIFVRPGVKDLDMGGNNYAQVRIAIDGTHFLKGMAVQKDGLPPGVDLVFNTNKSNTGNKLDAMKKIKIDKETGETNDDNPFGAMVRQITKEMPGGTKKAISAMNIVNDDDDWDKWSKNLPSQMLSKQSHGLAKNQLAMAYEKRKKEFDAIMDLTNPAVKRKLLEDFAEGADAAAVHLKAHALPGQKTHVILPIPSMKETEVYAPNYENGTRVVLIRFPHGGKFEIPELVVNNRNKEAKTLLGDTKNAVGINHKVAQKLSGADFDGDTVLVIPNNKGLVKHEPSLRDLKDFDHIARYKKYDGMRVMKPEEKGTQMGMISNLITDMSIGGATNDELARAVRHSMVVIDAEKHELNWKQSALDNGISQLALKYQGKASGGANTLISKAKGRLDVVKKSPRPASKGGPIDPLTGKKVYEITAREWNDAKGNLKRETMRSTKLAETDDAHTLSSGTVIESVYADHSNALKALANAARRESVHIPKVPYSDVAKKTYAKEVASLNEKLVTALKNAPLERQAQIIANAKVKQIMDANPGMEKSEIKKIKGMALATARIRMDSGKERVVITDEEWKAIQAGAITPNKLKNILDNADLDRVKALATPKDRVTMSTAFKQRARQMIAAGYTRAEVAAQLGVSVSTLSANLNEGS